MRVPRPLVRLRALPALVALSPLACDIPKDPAPPLDPTHVPGKGLTILALDLITLAAIRTTNGAAVWTYRPPQAEVRSFVQHSGGYLTCPPLVARNETLIVGYSDRIVVLDENTGLEHWTHAYPPRKEWTLCPAVAPDSGVLFIDPHDTGGRSVLIKLDLEGSLQWKTTLPDVGVVRGAPQVDDVTGDIVVQARAHAVGLSPNGVVNWVRHRSDLR